MVVSLMNDLSSVILSDVHCIFLRTMSVSFFTIELCGVIHGSAAVESPQSEYNEARDEPTSSVPTLPSLISFRPPKMPKSETSLHSAAVKKNVTKPIQMSASNRRSPQ